MHTGKLLEIDAGIHIFLQVFEDVFCFLDTLSSITDTLMQSGDQDQMHVRLTGYHLLKTVCYHVLHPRWERLGPPSGERHQ